MAQNDNAVITAAVGHVFIASPGAARPTPAQLDAIDPATFGSQVQTVTLTGTADDGTFTLSAGGDDTTDLPYDATAAEVQAALEALSEIGSGNVSVTGTLVDDFVITFIGAKQGVALPTLTADDTNLTGTMPTLDVSVTTAPNGWQNIGHTSRDDMPEFGFEGGDFEVRGSWQNESLREVVTEALADYLILHLHQFDKTTLELYFGVDADAEAGVFSVDHGTPVPVEKAFLVIITDGETNIGFYAAKASVRRDDAINMPVDEFTSFPVRATFLKHGNQKKFSWINEELFA